MFEGEEMSKVCFETLGAAKFPDRLKFIPNEFGISAFWEEFGPAKAVLTQEAKLGRSLEKIQGVWDKDHDYNNEQAQRSEKIAKEVQKLALAFPNTGWEYSPLCEHRWNSSKITELLRKCKNLAPNVTILNSPIAPGQFVSGFKNEVHFGGKLSKPHGPYNGSWDGLHCVDSDIEDFKKDFIDAAELWYWIAQFNCHAWPKDPRRTTKPDEKLINSILYIALNSKGKVKLRDGYIYKSHSQQDQPIDPQGNKPVVIQPIGASKAKKVELVRKGKVVASLNYGGVTEDPNPKKRRHVWKHYTYYGHTLGSLLTVLVDGKSVGTVNGGFRQNEYRNNS